MGYCKGCGGAMIAMIRGIKHRRRHYYGCAYHHKRGNEICTNAVTIMQDRPDQAVLHAIAELVEDRILEAAVEKALALLRAVEADHGPRRAVIERELALIASKEHRLTEAIAQGNDLSPLLTALRVEEAKRTALTAELEGFAAHHVTRLDTKRVLTR